MSTLVKKNYDNSYLFNQEADMHRKNLVEFIIKSDRIDKKSDSFRSIVEDVKRIQTSSVLYTVLMMDNVVLCYYNKPLSRAFKVFEAKDIKEDRTAKVFIDVTEIIQFKDGYYTCKKVDWLVTYLFNALGYLLYSNSTMKLLNNSAITISATECFVSMFNYIPDYLRIIGYSQNKEKISYLAGLYFLYNLMGKDLDTYSKNIAAKVAGISTSDTRAFELYYDKEKDFKSIDSFIELIANTFKLKGFTTEVFIHKWNYSFGNGTYFATELFTSFLTLMSSAYCGTYLVGQKQIERCCGSSMVNLCKAELQLGISELDNRGFMEAAELDKTIVRDRNTEALRESIVSKTKDKMAFKINRKECRDKNIIKDKLQKCIAFYGNDYESISKYVFNSIIVHVLFDMVNEKFKPEEGTLEMVLKMSKKYITDEYKHRIASAIEEDIGICNESIKEEREKGNKEKAIFYSKNLVELRRCKSYV